MNDLIKSLSQKPDGAAWHLYLLQGWNYLSEIKEKRCSISSSVSLFS
jgi:hypothetical protein